MALPRRRVASVVAEAQGLARELRRSRAATAYNAGFDTLSKVGAEPHVEPNFRFCDAAIAYTNFCK